MTEKQPSPGDLRRGKKSRYRNITDLGKRRGLYKSKEKLSGSYAKTSLIRADIGGGVIKEFPMRSMYTNDEDERENTLYRNAAGRILRLYGLYPENIEVVPGSEGYEKMIMLRGEDGKFKSIKDQI